MRIKDRHGRDFVIQPTSEEVVTDAMRQDIKSYKQLPKNLYQIQTKFRDERRPRFGLMRGREFTMKDAYSFDRDPVAAKLSYQKMAQAYRRIFDRFGLSYRHRLDRGGGCGGLGRVCAAAARLADWGEAVWVVVFTSRPRGIRPTWHSATRLSPAAATGRLRRLHPLKPPAS